MRGGTGPRRERRRLKRGAGASAEQQGYRDGPERRQLKAIHHAHLLRSEANRDTEKVTVTRRSDLFRCLSAGGVWPKVERAHRPSAAGTDAGNDLALNPGLNVEVVAPGGVRLQVRRSGNLRARAFDRHAIHANRTLRAA